jgi:putative transposase
MHRILGPVPETVTPAETPYVATISRSAKRECLGKFILFGRRHMDHIVSEWSEYYNTRRSHMVREHLPPVREKPEEVIQVDRDQVVARSYVGGLVKSFERRAA